MSLFLNNEVNTLQTYPYNSLIHTFNSVIFKDYDEAKQMLLEKTLLPGEVAFGYYNDPDMEYGINAIFAVGPIKNGTGNILFKNANLIDKELNEIKQIQQQLLDAVEKILFKLINL